jgi:hypothetical protein
VPATGLFMLFPGGAGTAISVALRAGQVNNGVVIVAVATAGLVSLIGVLAVNFPAIQRALSIAGIRRAVVKGKLPIEKAIELIRADEDIAAPAEQPSARKRRWR